MTRAPLEETETQENKQVEEKMCAAPGAEVKIVRMTRGRRMTDEAFAALSEKDKVRVLRNRRNALQTRARRQSRIATLKRDNALLEASYSRIQSNERSRSFHATINSPSVVEKSS